LALLPLMVEATKRRTWPQGIRMKKEEEVVVAAL